MSRAILIKSKIWLKLKKVQFIIHNQQLRYYITYMGRTVSFEVQVLLKVLLSIPFNYLPWFLSLMRLNARSSKSLYLRIYCPFISSFFCLQVSLSKSTYPILEVWANSVSISSKTLTYFSLCTTSTKLFMDEIKIW